jgi:FkbM family methyltransferase
VLAFVRRLATLPFVRSLTRFGPALRVSFALRGMLVQQPVRFASNEFRPRRLLATYRLRGSNVAIAIRHRTADVLVLDEVFSQCEYAAPEPVERVLRDFSILRIADLGANIGLFGAWVFSHYPGAAVLAIEAEPGNAVVHERAQAENDWGDRWRLIRAVASNRAGLARPAGGEHTTAAFELDPSGDVEAIDIFPHLTHTDWIKIDIEGGEWPILADHRFRQLAARVVVLEYHARGCPTCDPRRAAEDALGDAGYAVYPGTAKPLFGAGLLWGIKRP